MFVRSRPVFPLSWVFGAVAVLFVVGLCFEYPWLVVVLAVAAAAVVVGLVALVRR